MTTPSPNPPAPPGTHHLADAHPYQALIIKGSISGVLMGLANLVPGVSAGAVLLATGIFKAFISAMSDMALFKWRLKPMVLLGALGCGWVLAVLLAAGTVKQLVIDHRWIMYSIFIGLTLGGVPLVWQSKDKRSMSTWVGTAIGFAVMATLGLLQMFGVIGSTGAMNNEIWLLVVGGILAAGATVLPGGSGTFVLLLMGLYVPLLGAVDGFKQALTARDIDAAIKQMWTLVPFALGMGCGLFSVSVLLKWTLRRFEQSTMGVLLGLLLGSAVALWPFQTGVQPKAGDVVKGRTLTAEMAAALPADDWPVLFFSPSIMQILIAAALIGTSLVLTVLLARAESKLGGDESF